MLSKSQWKLDERFENELQTMKQSETKIWLIAAALWNILFWIVETEKHTNRFFLQSHLLGYNLLVQTSEGI